MMDSLAGHLTLSIKSVHNEQKRCALIYEEHGSTQWKVRGKCPLHLWDGSVGGSVTDTQSYGDCVSGWIFAGVTFQRLQGTCHFCLSFPPSSPLPLVVRILLKIQTFGRE